MTITWPHNLQAELAIWPTFHNQKHLPSGLAHFYEHLLFRQLKRALEVFAPGQPMILNGRTQTDHFYIYAIGHAATFPKGVMHAALTDPNFAFTEQDFLQEQQVVMREIEENKTVLEQLIGKIQGRYLDVPESHQGLFGSAAAIGALKYASASQNVLELLPSHTLLTCSPRIKDEPLLNVPQPANKLRLRVGVESFALTRKYATVCVLQVKAPSIYDILRVQVLDQILRHVQGPQNINTMVRERFGSSYGFHGLQVTHQNEYISTLTAFSTRPPSPELLSALRGHMGRLAEFLNTYGEQAAARLILEDEVYGNALTWLQKLPSVALRFGDATRSLFQDRATLLSNILPVELEISLEDDHAIAAGYN